MCGQLCINGGEGSWRGGGGTEGVRSSSGGHGKEVRVMSYRRSGGEDRGGSVVMNKEQKHLWPTHWATGVGSERTETMCRKLCGTLLAFCYAQAALGTILG